MDGKRGDIERLKTEKRKVQTEFNMELDNLKREFERNLEKEKRELQEETNREILQLERQESFLALSIILPLVLSRVSSMALLLGMMLFSSSMNSLSSFVKSSMHVSFIYPPYVLGIGLPIPCNIDRISPVI